MAGAHNWGKILPQPINWKPLCAKEQVSQVQEESTSSLPGWPARLTSGQESSVGSSSDWTLSVSLCP